MNWGGIVLDSALTYVQVIGQFSVPTANFGQNHPWHGYELAAFWVGLGGWNGNLALIQDGVTFVNQGPYWYPPYQQTYWAWIEYYSNSAIDLSLSVGAGQNVTSECYVSDSNGYVNPNGGYGAYYMWNNTTHQASGLMLIQAPEQFTGATAEAILERPGGNAPIPNYGSAQMQWDAYDSGGNYRAMSNTHYQEVFLVNSAGTYLTGTFDQTGSLEYWWFDSIY